MQYSVKHTLCSIKHVCSMQHSAQHVEPGKARTSLMVLGGLLKLCTSLMSAVLMVSSAASAASCAHRHVHGRSSSGRYRTEI